MSKCVTSMWGPSLRHCARATLPAVKKCGGGGELIGNTVFDWNGPIFELQTSSSRDERVTAQPSGWLIQNMKCKINIFQRFYTTS